MNPNSRELIMNDEKKDYATIYGFYRFNAFEQSDIRKASIINNTIAIVLIFVAVSLSKPLFDYLFSVVTPALQEGSTVKTSVLIFSVLAMFILFGLLVFLTIQLTSYFKKTLSNINADHRIDDFDFKNKVVTKKKVKESILQDGYFSANTYWMVYNENLYKERCLKNIRAKRQKHKDTQQKYKEFF